MENTNTDVFFRFIKEDKQFINITSQSICENPKETSGTEECPWEKKQTKHNTIMGIF